MGAANLPGDGGYAEKVLAEHARLYQVAKGKALPAPTLRAEATQPAGPSAPPATNAAPAVKVAALS